MNSIPAESRTAVCREQGWLWHCPAFGGLDSMIIRAPFQSLQFCDFRRSLSCPTAVPAAQAREAGAGFTFLSPKMKT